VENIVKYIAQVGVDKEKTETRTKLNKSGNKVKEVNEVNVAISYTDFRNHTEDTL